MSNLITARLGTGLLGLCFVFVLALAAAPDASAQERATVKPQRAIMATQAPAEIKSLCNPKKVESRDGGTRYTCEGKQPTPRPGGAMSVKSPGSGGLKAEINCSYSESGGAMKWTGCTCSANDDGNCTNFITWCAEQGDEVGGNSGSASCSPGS